MLDSVRRDEIETVACCGADKCPQCHGTGRKPSRGPGYLWADGCWHKDRAPSEENIIYKTYERHNDGVRESPSVKPVVKRKPVPKAFKATPRSHLRYQALSLAISSAPMIYRGTVTPKQILDDAEALMRWIADTPEEKL